MNAFANTLFSLLLSWVKGLVQSVWGIFSGGADGFFVWLGDHWLGLVVFICLLGAAADLMVWLLRWRPDLVWRTKVRRFRARLSGQEMDNRDQQNFYRGYEEAVDMEPGALWEENASWQQDDGYDGAPVPNEMEWWEQPETEEAYAQPDAVQSVQVRRRRGDKYQKTDRMKALRRIKSKLRDAQEDDTAMLDGLPSSVDSREAFYDPVFPQQENKQR